MSTIPLEIKPFEELFIGREEELECLRAALKRVQNGQGQVVFIQGSAGSGKTALVQAFLRQAQAANPTDSVSMLILVGTCRFQGIFGVQRADGSQDAISTQGAIGDPYQPFHEVLSELTSGAEGGPGGACDASDRKMAARQAERLASTAQILLEWGPDLIGTLVPGSALAELARAGRPGDSANQEAWRERIHAIMLRRAGQTAHRPVEQGPIIQQYTRVLEAMAENGPLVLILEDLHQADPSSINLFCHLASQSENSRMLLIGTYRQDGGQNSFEYGEMSGNLQLVRGLREIKCQYGDICIDLDRANQANPRRLIDGWLDAEPNRLDASFREQLAQQTQGHPLLIYTLLNHLKSSGGLAYNPDQGWVQGQEFNWQHLPARIEEVIARQIEQLSREERLVLGVASVIGREFQPEVIARVLGRENADLIRMLNERLCGDFHFVAEVGQQPVGRRSVPLYRFCHTSARDYAYTSLGAVEKTGLHKQVAQALEALYMDAGGDLRGIAAMLAHHYEIAGMVDNAVKFLQQAGNRAVLVGAYAEAAGCFRKALALLATLPEDAVRDRQELSLQLSLSASLHPLKGSAEQASQEAEQRIQTLCRKVGDRIQLLPALYSLRASNKTCAERQLARDVAEQILARQDGQEALIITVAHWALGAELALTGSLEEAKAHLEAAIGQYDSRANRWWAFLYGNDPGVASLARLAWVEWMLGYPDRAEECSQAAFSLARELGHPLVMGFAMGIAGVMFHQLRGEVELVREWNQASRQLSEASGLGLFANSEALMHGWVLAQQGEAAKGIEKMRQGLSTRQAENRGWFYPQYLGLLGSVYGLANQVEEGLAVLETALRAVNECGETYFLPELYRLSGELLIRAGKDHEAEERIGAGLAAARSQNARSWELRGTLSLARLWLRQGKQSQAKDALEKIYGWFNEGFNTPDLKAAQALLFELSNSPEGL